MITNLIKKKLDQKVGKHLIHETIKQFSNNKKTLDLGCGNSPTIDFFPNRVGVDIIYGKGVDIIADAHNLPFPDEAFGQIICSEVLEHLSEPTIAVKEMARVLVEEGRLILTVPFIYPIHEAPHDYNRFTYYGLKKMFTPFFTIEKIQEIYTEEQTIAILLQRIAFQRKNSIFQRYLYLLISHLIFNLSRDNFQERYQNISCNVPGKFMTAGYLLVARKKK